MRFSEHVKDARFLMTKREGRGVQIIDIGCGERPYARFFDGKYIGVDVHLRPGVDVLARAENLSFRDESFDVAICTQVLEHVADPEAVLNDTRRVLRKEGLLFLSTHGIWLEKHEKTDYWRWTLDGLVKLVAAAGFHIVYSASMKPTESLMQLLCLYFPSRFYPVHASLNILGSLLGKVLGPRGPRLHIDHVIVCRKG